VAAAREGLGLAAAPRSLTRRAAVLLAVAVVALAGAAVAAIAFTGGSPSAAPATGSLVRIEAASGDVVDRFAVPAEPTHVAVARGEAWFAAEGAVWKLDPRGGVPVEVEKVGAIHDLVSLRGTVYVARDGERLLDGIIVPYGPEGIRGDGVSVLACSLVADPSLGLWAAGCPNVQKISVEPGRLTAHDPVVIPFAEPTSAGTWRNCLCDMAAGAGSIWVVGDAADPRLWRIAPSERIEATVPLPVAPRSVAVTAGSAWVSAPLDDVVVRVDTATNRVVGRVAVGRGPAGVAAGGGAVWVASQLDGTVSRIDPATGRVTDRITVGGRPSELFFAGGSLWVTVDERA
jgi:YVTN family beta-propeller protein